MQICWVSLPLNPTYKIGPCHKHELTPFVHVFALYYTQLFKFKHGYYRIK